MMRTRGLSFGTLAVVCGLTHAIVSAQTAAAPTFDVVSVKPYTGERRPPTNTFLAGGRYVASSATLRSIIMLANQPLTSRQIVGAPSWMDAPDALFEIRAKTDGNPNVETLRAMLRALLAERFKLRTHLEKRPSSVYALVQARDGKPGPQLKPASVDCSNRRADLPPPDAEPQPLSTNCAFFMRITNYVDSRDASIGLQFAHAAKGVTMAQLASQLSAANAVGRVVVDRTGLTGTYDVDLTFAGTPTPGLSASSVFTAVEEQLGLKLESATAPVDFLVIDSVERPTAD